ncbi:MAG TPA: hypothetical protein DCR46_05200 [Cytophagales bacterium]|nr:hypothetical protein [Cytophagales bacterium]
MKKNQHVWPKPPFLSFIIGKNLAIGVVVFTLGLCVAMAISELGIEYGHIALVLAIGIPILLCASSYLHVGVFITFVASFFILGILRYIHAPLGLAIDFLILYLLLVMIVQIGREKTWSFAHNSIGLLVLVWILYNILQVANPFAYSRQAWAYSIRGMAGAMVFFYICLYSFTSLKLVQYFIQTWVFLSLLLAVYALFQEFHGLLPSEEAWIRADEERFNLYYNWGRFRKFSFFSDPTTFGITVAYTSVLCLVLSMGPVSIFQRLYYWAAAGIMAFSMLFSGTRTAYLLLPIGLVFLTIITLKRLFVVLSVFFLAVGTGIILSPIQSIGPLDSNALERLRSAFTPKEDPSFQVRLKNQEFIKPFIQQHPIGAGLGSVGGWGKRFSPQSELASFPPDSGFVKIAVELGWIGLALYCVLLFAVLKTGIKNYYVMQNPLLKNLQAGILCVLFCLIVANYVQEAITMYPTSLIFYAGMAFVTLLPNFEKNET